MEREIVIRIEKSCPAGTKCILRLRDATTFDWDKMYAFKYTAGEEEVERVLGARLEGFKELQRRIVFTKNGRVVFQEEEPTDVERPVKDEVVFDIPDNASYRVYSPDAEFSVSQMESEGGRYYFLTQVR